MSFFLLARSDDGVLSLLSEVAVESRQDALAELSRITASPDFNRWDDEVLLVDLASGTPVLLVRPAAPSAEHPESDQDSVEVASQPDSFATVADDDTVTAEGETEADADVEGGPDADAEDVGEPGADADVEPDADAPDAAETESDTTEDAEDTEVIVTAEEATAEEEVAAIEQSDSSEDGTSDEPEPVDIATEEAVEDTSEDAAMDSLRAAIARTTEQMEASGIVAPDSIGPAQDDDLDGIEPATADSDVPAEEPDAAPPAESEPAAWPWATQDEPVSSMGGTATDGSELEPDAVDQPEPEVEPEPEVAFVLEGLEEPALDDGGSLITSTIDDESLAASRPVILGAYDERPAAQEPDAGDAEGGSPEASDASASAASDASDETETPADDSDFIVLDPTTSGAPANTEAATDAEDVRALSSYVCDDCVYVETCPNKDQRRPEDCGSFQWK